MKSIGDSAPDALARVDLKDVELFLQLMPSLNKLVASLEDLRAKAKEEAPAPSTLPEADASRPESSDQSAAAAPTSDQRLLNPVVPENPAAPASDNPTT